MKTDDTILAQSTNFERAELIKKQVRKYKSPCTDKMFSIEIPVRRITYYFKTLVKQKAGIKKLTEKYPLLNLILKSPVK